MAYGGRVARVDEPDSSTHYLGYPLHQFSLDVARPEHLWDVYDEKDLREDDCFDRCCCQVPNQLPYAHSYGEVVGLAGDENGEGSVGSDYVPEYPGFLRLDYTP